MTRLTFLCLAVLLFANTSFAQTPEESPDLKDASLLAESVEKLITEKKFDEAFPLAKRALQIRDLEMPEYPRIAVDNHLTGRVIVFVVIDETGRVISASDMCQGPRYLTEAAIKASWKARFAPTILSGTPVKVKGVLQYNFRR